jgi:transposase InsO family protein
MTVQKLRYRAPPELYKPNCFNAIINIDFIGPLQTHKGDYACTMVDVHSGVMLAKAHKRPATMATIYTLWCWRARNGHPAIIESDQGTHFISQIVKKWVKKMDVMWNYYLAYNPQAAGNIEGHNGLLKLKLQYLKDQPLSRVLEIACTSSTLD